MTNKSYECYSSFKDFFQNYYYEESRQFLLTYNSYKSVKLLLNSNIKDKDCHNNNLFVDIFSL